MQTFCFKRCKLFASKNANLLFQKMQTFCFKKCKPFASKDAKKIISTQLNNFPFKKPFIAI